MAVFNIKVPNLEGVDLTDSKQMRRLQSYLLRLEEQLRFALSNIDESNLNQSLLNAINSKMSSESAESLIQQSAERILLMVKSGADDEEIYSAIEQTANAIRLEVSSTTSVMQENIDKLGGDLEALDQRVVKNTASIEMQAGQIQSKVSQEVFDALGRQVSANTSAITQTKDEIRLEVSESISAVQGEIDVLGGEVDALGGEIDSVNQAVVKNTAALSVQAGQIESKVSQEVFDALGQQVAENESTFAQTAQEIRSEVSKKVGEDEVKSLIKQSSDEIMLEVRKPASAVDTGNGIVINENGVDIHAGGGSQYIRLTDEMIEATDIRSATVSPRYAGERLLTVDPNATAEQMEAWGIYRNLSDALATINGRQLDGKIQINCADGAVMYGDAELTGVCGGEIEINGVDVMLYGRMKISGCSCTVYINKLGITAAEGAALSVSGAGQIVRLWACKISSVSADTVEAADGAKIDAVECTLRSESGKAAYMMRTAYGAFENCIGKGMLAARKAMLSAVGTVPDGGCEDWGGAIMNTEGTIPTGADGSAGTPDVATAEYLMLHSDSYRNSWSWTADNDIRQGYTGGRIRGCMWFDNDLIRAELAGKTIRQASLRLYAMKNVGRGVAVTAELYGTDKEYEGRSGAPALTASYGVIGSFEPGEATTITIPTQAVSDLVSGVINGLMLYSSDTELYSGRDYSRNYARFAGETSADEATIPILTVVCG